MHIFEENGKWHVSVNRFAKWYYRRDIGPYFCSRENLNKYAQEQIFDSEPEPVYYWREDIKKIPFKVTGNETLVYILFRAGKKKFMIYQRLITPGWRGFEHNHQISLNLFEEYFSDIKKPSAIPELSPGYEIRGNNIVDTETSEVVDSIKHLLPLKVVFKNMISDWRGSEYFSLWRQKLER